MAFAQEAIETEPQKERGPLLGSKRPVVLLMVAFVGLISLALWMSSGSKSKVRESAASRTLLVPDHESAAQVRRDAQAARSAPAVDRASHEPTPFPGDTLLVTDTVPRIQDSRAVDVAPGAALPPSNAGSAPSLMASQQANFNQYAMELQRAQLDMSRDALTSPSRVKAFEEQRKQSEDQAMQMFERMGQSGDSEEDMVGRAVGPSLAMLTARAGSGQGGIGGFGGEPIGGPTAGGSDPNMSQQKLSFFREGGQQLEPGNLGTGLKPQQTPFELQMGAIIPGILISGINSESPGQILGQVSENVYDSATGRHLLIPQGCRLVGTYSAFVAQGQTRVQVAWVRLNYPNGSSLDLGGMQGADQAGVSGFNDRVNRHFWKRLAAALLTTAFAVGYEATAPQNGGQIEGAVHRGVGESIVQLGVDMARQEGQLPPTLEIRAGYRFSIMVNKDIKFPGAYKDGIDRRVHRGTR